MKRATNIAIGIGTVLTFGLAAAVVSAHPHGYGPGWGMGGAPGYGMGYGPGPGRMGPFGYAMGPRAGYGMGPRAHGDPGARADAHLADLKSELKITPAQETAWQAFAAKAKQQAQGAQAAITRLRNAQTSAPDRLAQRNEFMKQRLAAMQTTTAAFKDLYAALAPEQKAIADRHLGGAGGGFGPGYRGGPGGYFR